MPAARVADLEARAGTGWGAVTLYIALREEAVPADFPLHAQVLTRYASTPPFIKPGAGDDVFLSLSPQNDELSAPRGWRTLTFRRTFD